MNNSEEREWDAMTDVTYSDVDVWATPIAGRGLGDVYHGNHGGEGGGKEVSVTKIPTDKLSKEAIAQLPREIQTLQRLRHPNIVQLVGFCRPPNCCLLSEFLRVSLQDAIYREQREFSAIETCGIFMDIASGMAYLHTSGVVHYDLTPANVFLDDELNAKISEFGMRQVRQETLMLKRVVGRAQYLSPELLSPDEYFDDSRPVDVYSFGILMAEVLSREPPFGTKDSIQIATAVLTQDLRPSIPRDTPEPIKSVVEAAWATSAPARPTFAQIVPRLRKARLMFVGNSEDGNSDEDTPVFTASQGFSKVRMAASVITEFGRPKDAFRMKIKKYKHAHELGTHANLLQYIKKDYENATMMYKRALKADPHHANNLGNYAHLLHYVDQDAAKAAKYYKSALEIEPHHVNNLGNYAALLHYMIEDFPSAGEHYVRALEIDPHHATNLTNYAEFLAYACNEIEKAEEFYTRGIKLNPGDHQVLRKYGVFLRSLKKTEGHANEVMNKADNLEKKGGAFFSRVEPRIAPKEEVSEIPEEISEIPVLAKTASFRSTSSTIPVLAKTASFRSTSSKIPVLAKTASFRSTSSKIPVLAKTASFRSSSSKTTKSGSLRVRRGSLR